MPRFDYLDNFSIEDLQKKLDALNEDYEFVMKKIEMGHLKGQEAIDLQNDIKYAKDKIRYITKLLENRDTNINDNNTNNRTL